MGQSQSLRLKILVVDDDPEVLEVTSAMLEAEGHTVLRATNGHKALTILAAHADIDLLFTDIVLPGSMDGFDLAASAKRRRFGLRVIYTSGYLTQEGIWDGTLLTKPWTKEDLKDAIAEIWPTEDGSAADRG